MFRIIAFLVALSCTAISTASAITIDWSAVGNPGNAPDSNGDGAVGYSYDIGTYDVTNSQYVAFLNSNDPTGADPLGLYNLAMGNPRDGSLSYNSGAANGSKYSVISGYGNYPMVYETWYEAIRFANWLNNGQVPGSTETGAYTLLGGTPTPSNGNSITRNPDATIVLPNVNEWYKAAYYNPTTSSYFQYPTSSNTAPNPADPTSTPNSANYYAAPGPTPVGAYTGTTSPSGAYDMAGNVWQWNESVYPRNPLTQQLRGAAFDWTVAASALSPAGTGYVANFPSVTRNDIGFRVAMIPEPSTLILAALGGLALLACRRRLA